MSDAPPTQAQRRAERQAAALRANLARRKAQSRARRGGGAIDGTGPIGADKAGSPQETEIPVKND